MKLGCGSGPIAPASATGKWELGTGNQRIAIRARASGQPHRKAGALSFDRAHLDPSAVRFDDLARDVETEADAAPARAGVGPALNGSNSLARSSGEMGVPSFCTSIVTLSWSPRVTGGRHSMAGCAERHC